MKTIIQKVIRASICVEKKYFDKINKGLLCYVAFKKDDKIVDILRTVNKISKLKIFDSQKSVSDIKGEILVVSQFTLYAEIKKGYFPKPIKLGLRRIGWPEHEVDAVMQFFLRGETQNELKAFIKKLETNRIHKEV